MINSAPAEETTLVETEFQAIVGVVRQFLVRSVLFVSISIASVSYTHLADLTVIPLNGICGIDKLTDDRSILEVFGQLIPVVLPGSDNDRIPVSYTHLNTVVVPHATSSLIVTSGTNEA